MALLSVTPCTLLKGTAADSDDGKNTAQKIFIVHFDAKPTDWDDIKGATGVPAIGEAFKSGDARKCKKVTPASMGTVLDYIVTCDFEVPGPDQFASNPVGKPDLMSGDFSVKSNTYFKDTSSTPQYLVNTAGEPFTQLPKRDEGIFKFVVTGNRASVPVSTWASYFWPATAINSSSVTILGITFTTGILRLLGIRYSPKTQGQFSYYEVEWTLAPNPNGWDDIIENRGFNELQGDYLLPIVLDDGTTRPAHPWPLDSDGSAMDDADDTPSTTTFKPYPPKDFSVFSWTT